MSSSVQVSTRFSAAHFYAQPLWSEERNRAEFGRCFTPHGHGHNYRLEVEFRVPEPGLSLEEAEASRDVEALREAVREEADRLDHQHLNFVVPEFRKRVPTTENIARALMERLQARKLPWPPVKLRLYEMDDLWVEIESEAKSEPVP